MTPAPNIDGLIEMLRDDMASITFDERVQIADALAALRAERDAALADAKRYREALSKAADDLAEAAVDVDSWGAYASEYFQEKHDLQGCVTDYVKRSEQARAALAAKEAP